MKGKNLRTGLLILAAVLLLALMAGCGKNDPSVLKLPEHTASTNAAPQETPAPLTPLGDRFCRVGQETIPESNLFSFILTSANYDPQQGLLLQLSYTNKSTNRSFLVTLDYLAVNGYMQDTAFAAPVAAGQSGTGEIRIEADSLRSAGISSVDELVLYPYIYDDSVPAGQGDLVDGAFSFSPTGLTAKTVVYPVRQRTPQEATFLDNTFATVVILSAAENAAGDVDVNCYLENKSDRLLNFAWKDVSINGTPVSTTEEAVVASRMRRYATLTVPAGELSAQGITSPGEVSFRMVGTPLSGLMTSPLFEQQGTYRFAATHDTSTGTDTDPGDEPELEPAATPDTAVPETATPAPTTVIYTSPTSAQKKNAKNGYVSKEGVNMRSGPDTKYKKVKSDIPEYTAVTLYELQDGWWFLKCDGKYGYIRQDMIHQGKAPKATEPPSEAGEEGKAQKGAVATRSKAAMRTEADKDSKCLTELGDGKELTVYYKTKGKDGKTWYYVSDGKHKGFIRSDLVKVKGKVPSK